MTYGKKDVNDYYGIHYSITVTVKKFTWEKVNKRSGGHPGIEPGTSRRNARVVTLSENHTTRPAALESQRSGS